MAQIMVTTINLTFELAPKLKIAYLNFEFGILNRVSDNGK